VSAFALIAERDLDWVASVVDIVAQTAGRPWRDALDRLEDLQRAVQPNAPRRFAAVVGAIQRVVGGRTAHIRAARDARSLVLGHPVFSAIERQARLAWAAEQLGTTAAVVETMLWSDLPRERQVELPYGRPAELEVAAFANVALIQRALRRAQSVTLRVTGDAAPILRAAKRRGLLVSATLEPRRDPTHVGANTARRPDAGPDNVSAETSSTHVDANAGQSNSTATHVGHDEIASATHAGANAALRTGLGLDNVSAETSSSHMGRNASSRPGGPDNVSGGRPCTHVGANAGQSNSAAPHVGQDLAPSIENESSIAGGATTIEIVGPLALFHRTNVYGRALADLAQMLGELRELTLDIHVETQSAIYSTRVESPVLLPAPPARLAAVPRPIARLARELARAAPQLVITPAPPLLVAGNASSRAVAGGVLASGAVAGGTVAAGAVACPDLLVERGDRRCYIEIVGFWTAEHVRRRLNVYRAAGANVILGLDATGACDDDEQPAEAVYFRKHVAAAQIVARLDGEWGSLCR
jgi:predicted nuclease of restriction endonuclease-like RecB superfamily